MGEEHIVRKQLTGELPAVVTWPAQPTEKDRAVGALLFALGGATAAALLLMALMPFTPLSGRHVLAAAAAGFSLTWTVQFAAMLRRLAMAEQSRPLTAPTEPAQSSKIATVELWERSNGRTRIRRFMPPDSIDSEQMSAVSRHLNDGGAFSRRELCSKRRILSQSQYADLLEALEARQLVARMPNNHIVILAAGRAVFSAFAEADQRYSPTRELTGWGPVSESLTSHNQQPDV